MKKLLLVGAAALAGAAVLSVAVVSAQEGPPPPPSAGSSIASGVSSTGADIGPDGALYAGVGGSAESGDAVLTLPADLAEMFGIESVLFGDNSTVMRVDPETGEVTTYADGLPSASDAVGGEPFVSPADVVWVGDTLYVLITGGAPEVGGAAADWPNGVYRLENDDSWTLVADITTFNNENPVDFPDAGPGGNPFAINYRGGQFIVSDGNYNRLLTISMDGSISILAAFDNIVPTGLETPDGGAVWNTWFSPAPHNPGDSFLVQVGFPTGTVTTVADEWAQLIDVELGPGGNVYVLQFGDQQLDENAPPPPGRLLLLQGDQLVPVVEGLMLPTSLNFSGDTAYITSLTGEVYAIPGVSALTPIEAEPTAAPTAPPVTSPTVPSGTVTPPDTGTGDGSQAATPWFAIVLLAVGSASCAALVKVRARS